MGGSLSGAKGTDAFENALSHGYLPSQSSIEYEGIFYNYYFKTPQTDKDLEVCYSFAITKDPLSKSDTEYYLGIGLGSKLDGEGLRKHGRPNLNMVICLDVSGSMDSPFDNSEGTNQSKLEVAKSSILTLLSRLRPEDSFSLVTFDTKYYVIHPMQSWKSTDASQLKEKIMSLKTIGGTSIAEGMNGSAAQFNPANISSNNENRIIFLTDMIVNSGTKDGTELYNLTKSYADQKIYTTFIGLGIDFNSNLVNQLNSVRASNYLSVKSAKEFKKNMEVDFDYLVTPTVFNITVTMNSNDWEVERVFGSPGYEFPKMGEVMSVNTMFPSPQDQIGSSKGGIVVMKLKNLSKSTNNVSFLLKYENRDGETFEVTQQAQVPALPENGNDVFDDTSVQKGVLLVRYVNFMKHFLRDAEAQRDPSITPESGITIPELLPGKNTTSHVKVEPLSEKYKFMFEKFAAHFEEQMEIIGDNSLEKEYKNLLHYLSIGEDKKIEEEQKTEQ